MKMRALAVVTLAGAVALPALMHAQAKSADKAFVSGGKVDIHLDAGDYDIRAAADNRVRVTMTGNTGSASVDVTVAGTHADVTVKNTPHTSFHCVIEVPKVADVAIRLSAGDLKVEEIAGSKDIEATAGNVTIAAGNANGYSKVDASVKVGDLSAGPFGEAKGAFISKSVNWSGPGTRTLRASLGAGNLTIR